MRDSGAAVLGVGVSSGKSPAEEAALQATSAPLIERSIERVTGVVYNITGGRDLTLHEVNCVSQIMADLTDPSANIIFGAGINDRYTGDIQVTMMATGFPQNISEGPNNGPQSVAKPPEPAPSPQSWLASSRRKIF